MAEVELQGQELLADIARTDTPAGTVAFWWLGQSGFVIKGGGHVVYVDPYLFVPPGGRRQTPALLRPEEVTNVDLILGSHDHSDHIDRKSLPAVLEASPTAKLVVSRVAAHSLESDGWPAERLVSMDDGEKFTLGGTSITGMRAAHEFFDRDPERGYPYLGFVIRMNGVTLFHTGDGVPWEGLHSAMAELHPDVLFVPINGRDGERYRRNCIGNFTFQEAVDLTGAARPRLAVPMHYDMFAGNREDVGKYTDYLAAKYPGIPCWVGPAGRRAVFA